MKEFETIIKSINITPLRDESLEHSWSYESNVAEVNQMLSYNCPDSIFSEMFKVQLSQLLYQRYVVIENEPISVPISSLLQTLRCVEKGTKARGKLNSISDKVGFEVQHVHFGESSFITENWLNHARKTKLGKQPLNIDSMYESLIESRSKPKKTGEWLVYSFQHGVIKFWCLWLHEAGDDKLVETIRQHI
ncbi:hypothetical protein AB4242_11555 [Vibrio splendidus]|uniref:Uncharacterized protein n=2 Tax=Vibrio cyclitrophicus TaxID=47951 RepID=A0A7Z1S3T4_9VIBR|nr:MULTISPECIES: hypothetical protein [Vibrio]PMP21882.1 hypothetical protein BCS91_19085 [Vibrio cyclitrophicus]PMP31564.1 hypothetical protein BCS90_11265 [Vibrio cyclitrophicus]PTP73557.1 hypothetical protein CWO23_06320 [Vibrio splendidus]TKE99282.1 hypothetical protein FCV46_19040 [Vibrio kanaloae]TKF62420.1 hypothetical protein FCV51_08425 [Vibrio kanaloae]